MIGGTLVSTARCASVGTPPGAGIDLRAQLTKGADGGRSYPPPSASFHAHLRSRPDFVGGIDYPEVSPHDETLVCAAAAGVVIGVTDQSTSGGMVLTIAHGLGWRTQYAHLKARSVSYRDRVARRDVIAVMGASGWGATRGGLGVFPHLHLTLWGPEFTPLFGGVSVQRWPGSTPGFRYALDPEEFSIGGRDSFLLYSRAEDSSGHDAAFRDVHDEATAFCDRLLQRPGDAETLAALERSRWEQETGFDYDVDQRIWLLWHRLHGATSPWSSTEAEDARATLRRFMRTVPRLTAPIVEASRRKEYRTPGSS